LRTDRPLLPVTADNMRNSADTLSKLWPKAPESTQRLLRGNHFQFRRTACNWL